MTIARIISGCKRNEQQSQKALYERYLQQLYRLAFRYLKCREDAEDCVAESFCRIFEKLKIFDYQEVNSFEVWMKRITVNECLMFLRKNKRLVFEDFETASDIGEEAIADENTQSEEIWKLIFSLPEGYRTVFNLYAIEGYQHNEIASMLGINESTSKTQLFKARSLLKKLLHEKLDITDEKRY